MSDFGKVALLVGGTSPEKEISKAHGTYILASLLRQGVDAHLFDPGTRPITDLVDEGFSRVYFGLFGEKGEDGVLQGALEMLNIPYTGSGVLASAISMNKVMTKQIWSANGLRSPPYRVIRRKELKDLDFGDLLDNLGGKVIVKDITGGTGIGLYAADTTDELQEALEASLESADNCLVERRIFGREFSVGWVQGKILPPIEVILVGDAEINNTSTKLDDNKHKLCFATLSPELDKECREIVARAIDVIGICDVARVDLFLGDDGKFYLLEVNTCPNLRSTSYMAYMLQKAGIQYDDFVYTMLKSAKVGKL